MFKPSTRSSECPEEQILLFVLQMSTLYVDVGDDVHSVAAADADRDSLAAGPAPHFEMEQKARFAKRLQPETLFVQVLLVA